MDRVKPWIELDRFGLVPVKLALPVGWVESDLLQWVRIGSDRALLESGTDYVDLLGSHF